ncbi:hypothetical protein [Sphingosinicella terrae]|uniref:hypothetical protein n=1 Tax=Sphingosinicella terrae TaxID=2172047 RepID=UPI000E0D825B|nr:hypothetical protein [Sphingosinicella terrae]
MMRNAFAALLIACAAPAGAQTAPVQSAPSPAPTRLIVEIYRIAPGQHTAFLEAIASYDEANRRAGLPPRQLYVHSEGADWDFMLIQPAETPENKRAALDAAWQELGLPSGADFFLQFRTYIAEHSDTFVRGPTTAADFLATRAQARR